MNTTLKRRQVLAGLTALPFFKTAAQSQNFPILSVASRTIEVFGKAHKVFGVTGPKNNAGLNILLEERFHYRVQNDLLEPTVLHWHGLTPPNAQDGVPMLTQAPIPVGGFYDYDFENLRSGTHWMHSHLGLQEQLMLAAPLIVRETAEPLFDVQEHVIMLHDFTFRAPEEILAELKNGKGAHSGHDMAMMTNDVNYDAILANDRTLMDPEIVQIEKSGAVRLRIINGAAASNMWIDLGGLTGELIAVDGNAVLPIVGSMFPLAIAQRADIRLRLPVGAGAWPILFRSEGSVLQAGVILRSGKAKVEKIALNGETPAPAIDLALELELRSVIEIRDEPITRTETLAITGGGADYLWALNGKTGMHDTLFTVTEGERIAVVMHNQTAMAHPMHLHGHYFKVIGVGDRRINGALRDTVLVPPGETVTIQFDADNPGNWAFHCHHLYHMNSGMMGAITYRSAA